MTEKIIKFLYIEGVRTLLFKIAIGQYAMVKKTIFANLNLLKEQLFNVFYFHINLLRTVFL